MKQSTIFAALSALIPYVAAHGFVSQVVIDGDAYAGNTPGQNKGPSPIRTISDISPVKGASNPDLFCGLDAKVADVVAPANPGSTISFQWSGGGGQLWPHNTGPLITYMAKCGDTTCDKYDATDAQWFKIDEAGKKDDSTWVQADIMKGKAYTLNLPDDLEPGDYLIRHEIIALHLAVSKGGAEFYPSCTQVRIGGSGTGTPTDTVTFPGAYSDSDPGIFDPNVFDDGAKYTFPGPAIQSNLAATNGKITAAEPSASFHSADPAATTPASTKGSGSGSSSTQAASAPAASATGNSGSSGNTSTSSNASSSGSKASCKLKKRSTESVAASNVNRPRHYSRIMRRILHAS